MIYLQGQFSEKPVEVVQEKSPEYKLQVFDIILVRVQSVDPQASVIFNTESIYSNNQNTSASFYITGYPINDSGYVSLPVLGPIKVAGYTTAEVQRQIEKKLMTYFKNPKDLTVTVKMVSYRISVLGEVNRPGQYYVYNNHVTLFEALAMAGDLTVYGDRANIKLVRQTKYGVEVSVHSLKDPKILQSEAFYLLPNDVIYIQPLKYKNARNNITLATIFFTGISTVILILNFVAK